MTTNTLPILYLSGTLLYRYYTKTTLYWIHSFQTVQKNPKLKLGQSNFTLDFPILFQKEISISLQLPWYSSVYIYVKFPNLLSFDLLTQCPVKYSESLTRPKYFFLFCFTQTCGWLVLFNLELFRHPKK